MPDTSPKTTTLSTGATPQILKLTWANWVKLRQLFFDAVSSQELTALLRTVVDMIRAEGQDSDAGEVEDALTDDQPLLRRPRKLDWNQILEAGIPAIAKGAKQLNTLELDFIRAVALACSTIDSEAALDELPVVDVYRLFDAASAENSIIDLIAAEKNLWAPVLEAIATGDE